METPRRPPRPTMPLLVNSVARTCRFPGAQSRVSVPSQSMFVVLVFLTFLFAVAPSLEIELGGLYEFSQAVSLFDESTNPVGYKLSGKLKSEKINQDLFLFTLDELQLYVQSSKSSATDGFLKHDSKLPKLQNRPFLVEFVADEIKNVHLAKDDDPSMSAIKKGIASLLQFKKSNGIFQETDTSGTCTVDYKMIGNHITKKKTKCKWDGQKNIRSRLWGTKVDSKIYSEIALEKGLVSHVVGEEEQKLSSTWNSLIQLRIITKTELKMIDSGIIDKSSDLSQIKKELGFHFEKQNFKSEKFLNEEKNVKLFDFVKSHRKTMTEGIGSSKSAWMLLNGIKAAQKSTSAEILEILNNKKNKREILEQVLDILGSTATEATHKAAMEFLRIDSRETDVDLCDRYLWALSLNPKPPLFIINDLFKIAETRHGNVKVWQTLVLSVPAIVYRYVQQNPLDKDNENRIQRVLGFLNDQISRCEDDDVECLKIYLRAFVNVPIPQTIHSLLLFKHIYKKGVIVEIMNALQTIESKYWTKEVYDLAEEVYLANSTYDSSARVIALNMLLTKVDDESVLTKVLSVLKHDDISRELRQYLLVSLEQLYEKYDGLRKKIFDYLNGNKRNNYDAWALSGFSTKFHRDFMNGGRLSTSQEIVSGVLKNGIVNVDIVTEEYNSTAFSFGLYSRGLSSLMSGGEDSGETSTAGMQLRVLDVSLRPLVFFTGNGELMGHVFSGTASTLTPAYQALVLIDNDKIEVPLSIGNTIDISFSSGASVDLSGQTEISLWHKTSKTLVQNKAGLAFEGKISLNLPFVKSEVEFNIHATPELFLLSSVNFYDTISMCLQLVQPESTIRYNTFKVERIVGSKHKVRKSRKSTILAPGRSYALTNMNNAMCNVLAKQGWFDDT